MLNGDCFPPPKVQKTYWSRWMISASKELNHTLWRDMTECSGIRRNAKHPVLGFVGCLWARCPTKLWKKSLDRNTGKANITYCRRKSTLITLISRNFMDCFFFFLQWKKGQDWGHRSSPTVYIPMCQWIVKSEIQLLQKKNTESLTEFFLLFLLEAGTASCPPIHHPRENPDTSLVHGLNLIPNEDWFVELPFFWHSWILTS